jgi:hypothetical protein
MHYTRLLRHGSPHITYQPERYMTAEQRFWSKVDKMAAWSRLLRSRSARFHSGMLARLCVPSTL